MKNIRENFFPLNLIHNWVHSTKMNIKLSSASLNQKDNCNSKLKITHALTLLLLLFKLFVYLNFANISKRDKQVKSYILCA